MLVLSLVHLAVTIAAATRRARCITMMCADSFTTHRLWVCSSCLLVSMEKQYSSQVADLEDRISFPPIIIVQACFGASRVFMPNKLEHWRLAGRNYSQREKAVAFRISPSALQYQFHRLHYTQGELENIGMH